MIHPIVDEFWSPNPSHTRSTQFALTKGQTTTNSKKEVITNGGSPDSKGRGGPDAVELGRRVQALR